MKQKHYWGGHPLRCLHCEEPALEHNWKADCLHKEIEKMEVPKIELTKEQENELTKWADELFKDFKP